MNEFYQTCLARLMEEYTSGEFYREVYESKKEFFENIGGINEDDTDFENQMDLFMGWYLFCKPLNNFDLPPVQLFYRKKATELSPEDLVNFKALTNVVHSVFEVTRIRDEELQVRDFCTREKLDIISSKNRFGFSKGDIFEARLVPHEKKFYLLNGFCIHHREAIGFIEEQMRKIRDQDHAQRTKLMLRLNHMRYKHNRFPHIAVENIYTLTPKF